MPVIIGGHNVPPMGEIELTDLPKSGGVMALMAPPGTTPLILFSAGILFSTYRVTESCYVRLSRKEVYVMKLHTVA